MIIISRAGLPSQYYDQTGTKSELLIPRNCTEPVG